MKVTRIPTPKCKCGSDRIETNLAGTKRCLDCGTRTTRTGKVSKDWNFETVRSVDRITPDDPHEVLNEEYNGRQMEVEHELAD